MSRKFTLPDNFFYWQDQNFIIRFLFSLVNGLNGWMFYLLSPPAYKKWNFFKFVYKDLAPAFGFEDEQTRKTIAFHDKRITTYTLVLIFSATTLVSLLLIFAAFLSFLIDQNLARSLFGVGNIDLAMLIYFFIYLGFLKMLFAFLGSSFSESLTALSSIDILVELSSDDVLSNIRKKRMLIKRINQLAQHTLWLSIRNRGTSPENQIWLRNHFRNIVRFIYEQEKSVLASTQTTLDELRDNFYYMAQIFVSGNYGEFDKVVATPPEQQEQLTAWQRFFAGLTRFLAVFLPLGVLGYLLLQPSITERLGIDPGIVSLIFIAWLLLAIDNFFKLGIISTIFSVAREIRDLRS